MQLVSEVLTVGAAALLENVNAALIPKLFTIGGVVCDEETLLPLAGVMVKVNQVPVVPDRSDPQTFVTGSDGRYEFTVPCWARVAVDASFIGYDGATSDEVSLRPAEHLTQHLPLRAQDALIEGWAANTEIDVPVANCVEQYGNEALFNVRPPFISGH